MSPRVSIEQADAVAKIVRECMHPAFASDDDELVEIRIRPTDDGWEVLIGTLDSDESEERSFQFIVTADGATGAPVELN